MRRLAPVILVAVALAGCGSSGSTTSTSGPSTATGAPPTTTEVTTTETAPTTTTETPGKLAVSTCDYQTLAGCSPVPTSCHYRVVGEAVLPDPACTPGALYGPSQEDPSKTVCVSGFTKTIRPPVSYTGPLKLKIMAAYGVTDPAKYELDHLVALEDGGAPADPANLWPQPYSPSPGAHNKDDLENFEKRQVCEGKATVLQAGEALSGDWLSNYEHDKPPHETFGRGFAP